MALRFQGHLAAVKDVLHALTDQHQVLDNLGSQNQLDEKLAQYAFFPLTQVLNQSQRLSPRCMQTVVQSLTILVGQGWRLNLDPKMGKELLVLMSLIAGGDPRKQAEAPTDELKCAAFRCMQTLVSWLALSPGGKAVLQDQSTRNVVDQLAYLLVENIPQSSSDDVQIAAAEALLELFTNISERIFLASLLPRTVSSLVKALRPSTQARRTRKVLTTDLTVLGVVLRTVLADDVSIQDEAIEKRDEVLDSSWLKATVAQVKNALLQVVKLRSHDHADVRTALASLCFIIVDNCSKTLEDCMSMMVETLVILTEDDEDKLTMSRLKNILMTRLDLVDLLQSSFYDWTQSMPRIMQGNDDKPKKMVLTRITSAFEILSQTVPNVDGLSQMLSATVLKTVTATLDSKHQIPVQIQAGESQQHALLLQDSTHTSPFEPILYNHQSERESSAMLLKSIADLQQHPNSDMITRDVIDRISEMPRNQRMAPIWLALQLLRPKTHSASDLDEFLDLSEASSDPGVSRSYLINTLYLHVKDILLESSPYSATPQDPRLTALALESLVLQAQQLGSSYRDELYETLYPVLALLSSSDNLLRNHAMTALNLLASCCEYSSVSALLVENVDYLVNSIAWKMNTFNLSPEAPAVLNMVIRLVGAKLIPHLDDLIASIFAALDNFHGYTQWVELLFEVLRTMVDESTKYPDLMLADVELNPQHHASVIVISTSDDILESLQARKRRKIQTSHYSAATDHTIDSAPRRPWTREKDDPNYKPDPTEGKDIETLLREAETADEENDLPAPKAAENEEDPSKPMNKTHDLLLKITQATVPHLSSPSPRVRQVLLQLLTQIAPLLARHENTFLPLINAIWPGVVQRLFAEVAAPTFDSVSANINTDTLRGELPYNISASADLAAILCEHAGDFMRSRAENIFPQLKSTYTRLWKDIDAQLRRNDPSNHLEGSTAQPKSPYSTNIRGTVVLQLVSNDIGDPPNRSTPSQVTTMSNSLIIQPQATSNLLSKSGSSISRTSNGQIFASLVRLLVSIITHVRIGEDHGDEVFDLLAPLVDFHVSGSVSGHARGTAPNSESVSQLVTNALQTFNADKLWVVRARRTIENEIVKGERSVEDREWRERSDVNMPVLREELMNEGLRLQLLVL